MTRRPWGNVPYLDALRPDPGWRTDVAVIATYSADLVALVAALLALGGVDDERGSGSKVDFVKAFDELRGRVFVLAQAGRLVTPPQSPKVLALLDRFVRTVPFDEAERSWHPKVSLVRLESESDRGVEWRLWIGSRNLSRDTSWDVGLALVGRSDGAGADLPGVAGIAAELLARTDLSELKRRELVRELGRLRWEMPSGCQVEEARLLGDGARGLPAAPDRTRLLIVASPFLDAGVVGKLGRWGDETTRRVLVSTLPELKKLAELRSEPLKRFTEVLYLDTPDLEVPADEERGAAGAEASDDETPERRGLHAKLIYTEHAAGRTLWLGSANATQRGWDGPNAEIVARASVSADMGRGLEEFVKTVGRIADLSALPAYEDDTNTLKLEEARRQLVARWEVVARYRDGSLALDAVRPPHPDDQTARLEVGLVGRSLTEWPRGVASLSLGAVSGAELTEFVQCRVTLGELSAQWIQRTPLDPPLDAERDRLALARYLDPRTFLLWIRSLLTLDGLHDGGGDWNASPAESRAAGAHRDGPVWWAPTLEEVLRAWSRDPASVIEVDRKVRAYLELVGENPDAPLTEAELGVVDEFRKTWDVLRGELLAVGP